MQAVLQFKWNSFARSALIVELCIFLTWLLSFSVFSLIWQVRAGARAGARAAGGAAGALRPPAWPALLGPRTSCAGRRLCAARSHRRAQLPLAQLWPRQAGTAPLAALHSGANWGRLLPAPHLVAGVA
jgi:hypothetical protein